MMMDCVLKMMNLNLGLCAKNDEFEPQFEPQDRIRRLRATRFDGRQLGAGKE